MSVSEEKLAGVDQALAELGKSDEEISEVRGRFANAEPVDLQAVDGELSELSDAQLVDSADMLALLLLAIKGEGDDPVVAVLVDARARIEGSGRMPSTAAGVWSLAWAQQHEGLPDPRAPAPADRPA